MAKYDREVQIWLTEHSPFFVFAWSLMVMFISIAMMPVEIYLWIRGRFDD